MGKELGRMVLAVGPVGAGDLGASDPGAGPVGAGGNYMY